MLAASVHYPIRGAVTFKSTGRHQRRFRRARQSRLRRRHRRRADHRRRGLWRRLLDHAGAQPRLRDEVAGLAARSAARTCRRSSRRSRTASSCPRPRNTPVMLEVRIRSCHVHGRFIAKDNKRPAFTVAEALEKPRRDTDRIVLPPASYPAREGEDREALAGGGRLHQGAQAQRVLRRRQTARSASSCRAACTIRCIRALQQLGLADVYGETDGAALRAQRHLSADRRRVR